jgi:hypothetical protein
MTQSTITWGTTRTGERITCTVFCHVCREVFGRGLDVNEARECKEEAEQRHSCGRVA